MIIDKKFAAIFLAILVLFCIIRAPALTQDVYGDEFYYYLYAKENIHSHPELENFNFNPNFVYFIPIIFYKAGYILTGGIVGIRMISLLFGLANMTLTMFFIRRYYNEKASIVFGLLYSIIPWTVFSSVLLDNDGTIISLLFILLLWILGLLSEKTVVLENKTERNSRMQKALLFFSGAVSGCLFFLKFITMFPIILAFFLSVNITEIRKRDFSLLIGNSIIIATGFFISIILLASIYSVVFGPEVISKIVIHYIAQTNTIYTGLGATFVFRLLLMLVFFSPLMFLILPAMMKEFKNGLFETFTKLSIILFSFFMLLGMYVDNHLAINRYFSIMLVPIIMMISLYIVQFIKNISPDKDKKYFILVMATAICFSFGFFFFHTIPHDILNLFPTTELLVRVLKLQWNVLVPINGSSGPMGFYVSLITMATTFLASGALFVLFLLSRKISIKKIILLLFLSVSVAYCIYINMQFLLTPAGPFIIGVNREMRIDAINDTEYYVFRDRGGFFAHNNASSFTAIKLLDFPDENNQTKIEEVLKNHQKVFILDFPQLNKQSSLWLNITEKCNLTKTYYSRGWTMGYIFSC